MGWLILALGTSLAMNVFFLIATLIAHDEKRMLEEENEYDRYDISSRAEALARNIRASMEEDRFKPSNFEDDISSRATALINTMQAHVDRLREDTGSRLPITNTQTKMPDVKPPRRDEVEL